MFNLIITAVLFPGFQASAVNLKTVCFWLNNKKKHSKIRFDSSDNI